MGKPRKRSSGSKKPQSGPREVAPEVYSDKKAANQLSFSKPQYQGVNKNNKARDRAISRKKLNPLKKKERVFTEKELDIPKLNTALQPVGVKVKGKKGKKFIDDDKMQLILAEVQQTTNAATASKLEKARQLESIREIRRKEMEEREQAEKDKVNSKKKELKNKKKPSDGSAETAAPAKVSSKKSSKKRVSFA